MISPISIQDLAQAHKSNVDAMHTLADAVLTAFDRMTALTLGTSRSLFDQGREHAEALLAGGGRNMLAMPILWSEPAAQHGISYLNGCREISTQTHEQISTWLTSRAAALTDSMHVALDRVAEAAPASAAAVAAAKSTLAAASATYDQLIAAGRQAGQSLVDNSLRMAVAPSPKAAKKAA